MYLYGMLEEKMEEGKEQGEVEKMVDAKCKGVGLEGPRWPL